MHRSRTATIALSGLALLTTAVAPGADFDPTERYTGGATTGKVVTDRAYSQFARNLDFVGQGDFKRGDLLFRGVHRGLGPLINARTCQC